MMWSDNGSNFVGAARELRELFQLLKDSVTQQAIADFCSSQHIQWKFIPERAPHFGGLWEAAVKSMKVHLRKIVGDVKLSFEELATVLTQVEACLNSRPLTPLPDADDGFEALTPGHFLVGQPLEAIHASMLEDKIRRQTVDRKLAKHLRLRLGRKATTGHTCSSDRPNDPASPHDVKTSTERCSHKCGTSMQKT